MSKQQSLSADQISEIATQAAIAAVMAMNTKPEPAKTDTPATQPEPVKPAAEKHIEVDFETLNRYLVPGVKEAATPIFTQALVEAQTWAHEHHPDKVSDPKVVKACRLATAVRGVLFEATDNGGEGVCLVPVIDLADASIDKNGNPLNAGCTARNVGVEGEYAKRVSWPKRETIPAAYRAAWDILREVGRMAGRELTAMGYRKDIPEGIAAEHHEKRLASSARNAFLFPARRAK